MHKTKQFLRENAIRTRKDYRLQNHHLNNIIFLDIDGVIQPPSFDRRFVHNMEKTTDYLADKYQDDIYLHFDIYDLAAAYYDWSYIALGYLRELIEDTNSNIVLHSTWSRYNSFDQIKALFRLYDLDQFIIDIINEDSNKTICINNYLSKHPEIDNYIIIDDDYILLRDFGEYCCQTAQYFKEPDFKYSKMLLSKNFDIKDSQDNNVNTIEIVSGKKILAQLFYQIDIIDNESICLFTINSNQELYTKVLINHLYMQVNNCIYLISEQIELLKNTHIGYISCGFRYHDAWSKYYLINKANGINRFDIEKNIETLKERYQILSDYFDSNSIYLKDSYIFKY